MDSQVKDHLVVVHTKNSAVGHVTVEIIGPVVYEMKKGKYVRGFYPASGLRNSALAFTTFDALGEVRDDEPMVKNPDNYKSSQAIAVTRAQAEAMIAKSKAENLSPPAYDLNDHNCVDFANDMIHAGGIPGDVQDYLTKEQIQSLSGASIYASVAYGGLAKGEIPTAEQRQRARHGLMQKDHLAKALSPDQVVAEYAQQGIAAKAAVQHWTDLVSKTKYGQEAAELGLTVGEAEAIYSVANGVDIGTLNIGGTARIAAERYLSEFEHSKGNVRQAMDYAREGLADARKYQGPSQEFSPGESQLNPEKISRYIDTFRDRVELSRVRGDELIDLTIDGVPEGASLGAGSTSQPQQARRPRVGGYAAMPPSDYLGLDVAASAAKARALNVDTSHINLGRNLLAVQPNEALLTLGEWSPLSAPERPQRCPRR